MIYACGTFQYFLSPRQGHDITPVDLGIFMPTDHFLNTASPRSCICSLQVGGLDPSSPASYPCPFASSTSTSPAPKRERSADPASFPIPADPFPSRPQHLEPPGILSLVGVRLQHHIAYTYVVCMTAISKANTIWVPFRCRQFRFVQLNGCSERASSITGRVSAELQAIARRPR